MTELAAPASDSEIDLDGPLVVYDGECIFCQNYVKYMRLRKTVGPVELLDARSDDDRVTRLWRSGFDLNHGMVFVYGGEIYHGDRAIQTLALLSSKSSLFNRLNKTIFRHSRVAAAMYPLLKLGRRVTLAVRGKRLMVSPNETEIS